METVEQPWTERAKLGGENIYINIKYLYKYNIYRYKYLLLGGSSKYAHETHEDPSGERLRVNSNRDLRGNSVGPKRKLRRTSEETPSDLRGNSVSRASFVRLPIEREHTHARARARTHTHIPIVCHTTPPARPLPAGC